MWFLTTRTRGVLSLFCQFYKATVIARWRSNTVRQGAKHAPSGQSGGLCRKGRAIGSHESPAPLINRLQQATFADWLFILEWLSTGIAGEPDLLTFSGFMGHLLTKVPMVLVC